MAKKITPAAAAADPKAAKLEALKQAMGKIEKSYGRGDRKSVV